jgi:signal transduction histidine kinase
MTRLLPARGLRARLVLAVAAVMGLALVVLTIGFNLVLANRLNHDRDAVLRSRAESELGALATVNGRLVAREAPDDAALDSQVWVFAGRRIVERPRAAPVVERAAERLAAAPSRMIDVPGQKTRLLSVPVVRNGRELGTVVTGISLAAYERTERIALIASLVFASLLLIAVVLVARAVIGLALRPVARMTAEAADWTEHGLDRRFGLGPPHDELTQLAATLDGMLDRLADSLRREQRFSAELSHELRTPLAGIRAEAELALRRERSSEEYRQALEQILRKADQMDQVIDALVSAARAEAGAARETSDGAAAATSAVEACADASAKEGVRMSVVSPQAPVWVRADADLIQRILAPLLENGCRFAESEVTVTVARSDGEVRYEIEDDGPGVDAGAHERIFEPGVRGSREGSPAGAGLGMALARRLARALGGDVVAGSNGPGAHFSVRLPASGAGAPAPRN